MRAASTRPDGRCTVTDRPTGVGMSQTGKVIGPVKSSDTRSPLVLRRSKTDSGEGLCGNDLIVWHVAYMLSDVPAMPEVLELAETVAPEHVRQ
jgi:hypothetical protein